MLLPATRNNALKQSLPYSVFFGSYPSRKAWTNAVQGKPKTSEIPPCTMLTGQVMVESSEVGHEQLKDKRWENFRRDMRTDPVA
jgi:hypothetical protein